MGGMGGNSEEQTFHQDQGDGYDDDNPYLPRSPEAYRAAWADLEGLWDETVTKALTLDEDLLHESVDGEWSFVQTLRHLLYATDLWVFAVVQGHPDPYSPHDLPFDGYERFDNPIPYERDARVPLADVLALRADRIGRVRSFLDGLTQDGIESTVEFRSDGWPFDEDFLVGHCLSTVVNEEWHHRGFAERDLDTLIARSR
jgi:uncharacterized damage-inducible protein DinB